MPGLVRTVAGKDGRFSATSFTPLGVGMTCRTCPVAWFSWLPADGDPGSGRGDGDGISGRDEAAADGPGNGALAAGALKAGMTVAAADTGSASDRPGSTWPEPLVRACLSSMVPMTGAGGSSGSLSASTGPAPVIVARNGAVPDWGRTAEPCGSDVPGPVRIGSIASAVTSSTSPGSVSRDGVDNRLAKAVVSSAPPLAGLPELFSTPADFGMV